MITDGIPIVLTASAAEMSQYYDKKTGFPSEFKAFTCTFPYKLTNMLRKFQVPDRDFDGSARFAPFGLRVVESALVAKYGRDSVVVCHPYDLDKFVGPDTKMVGVSTMDPAGLGYVSITYNSIIGFGGKALDAKCFEELMENPAIKKFGSTIVVGGQGAWQIEDAGLQKKLGVDILVKGQGLESIGKIAGDILGDNKVQQIYETEKPDYNKIPHILKAACYGAVEITRGCGRGCQFCSPTAQHGYVHSFSLEDIMANVETNVNGGSKMIFTTGEDTFLYGAENLGKGFIPNREAITKLYSSIANYPGVEYIHLSHASIAPILHDKKILKELTPILMDKSGRHLNKKPYVTVEVGVESGSTRIMNIYNKGKAKPFNVDNWPSLVREGLGEMNDNTWYPLITIITGWPKETEDDNIKTLELVESLKPYKTFIVPNLFIPLEEALLSDERRKDLHELSETQWDIIASAWKHNISVWADQAEYKNYSIIARAAALALIPFIKNKHGNKAIRPVMKFAGITLGKHISPEKCDSKLCK